MIMPVMEIRPVLVFVGNGIMGVQVRMFTRPGEGREIFDMLMIMVKIIMSVTMVMHQGRMVMPMCVLL